MGQSDMGEEEWRSIPGWAGLYEVSDLGRVRSLPRLDHRGRRVAGGIRKLQRHEFGYPMLQLKHDGKSVNVTVHSVLAAAFIGRRPRGQQVRHKDGIAEHTYLSNLEYGTRKENQQDMARHGKAGRHQASKTHCRNGHEYSADNTIIIKRPARRGRGPSTERRCRICAAAADARNRGK